jgi:hypothetical protein
MGLAGICYNPKVFTPRNSSLLSLGQWQKVQLFLVDAMNLPLNSDGLAYSDVLPIYKKLHAEAVAFHDNTLPQAHLMGNDLYRYGRTANRTLSIAVQLMDAPTPNKEAIVQLLGKLQTTAETYQTGANDLFRAVDSYIALIAGEISELDAALQRETAAIAASNSPQIVSLQKQYQSKYADMQQAQAQLVRDENQNNITKSYVFRPLIGTVLRLDVVSDDLKVQKRRIDTDIQEMQNIQRQIQGINNEIGHLIYVAQYNQHMATEMRNAMEGLKVFEGAWSTIASELGDVVENVKKAAEADLKNQPGLAGVALATAASEWQDVANDAHSFDLYFYIRAWVG